MDRFEQEHEGGMREDSEGAWVKAEDAINQAAILNAQIETLKAQLKLAGVKGDIATGHAILKTHLNNDESYAWSWQSNIACAIMDAVAGEDEMRLNASETHRFANETTVRIMRNIFDFDSSQLASYKAFGYNDDSDNAQTELPV